MTRRTPLWLIIVLLVPLVIASADIVRHVLSPALNHDAGWYLYAAEGMLDGKKLYVDFIDANPPTIYYLSMVPVLVHRWLGLPIALSFELVMLGSIFLCAALCTGTLRASCSSRALQGSFIAWLLFALIPAARAMDCFGQREHIFLILFLPYLVLVAAPPSGGERKVLRSAAAALAAVGMCLKPHFLLAWLSVEAARLYVDRGVRAALRIENVIIAGVSAAYAVFVLVVHPEYVTQIIPWARAAYGGFDNSLQACVEKAGTLLLVLIAPVWLMPLSGQARRFRLVFSTAAVACALAAVAQRKGWDYHLYPASMVGFLTLSTAVGWLLEGDRSLMRLARAQAAVASAAIVILVQVGRSLETRSAPQPSTLSLLQSRFEGQQHPTLALFSFSLFPSFPLVNLVDAQWALRYPHLWLVPGGYKDEIAATGQLTYHKPGEQPPAEAFMFESVVNDLIEAPPRFLVVDNSNVADMFGPHRFDFVRYFAQDDRFRKLFEGYKLTAQLHGADLVSGSFDVYERAGAELER